jgi:hypothetical protein
MSTQPNSITVTDDADERAGRLLPPRLAANAITVAGTSGDSPMNDSTVAACRRVVEARYFPRRLGTGSTPSPHVSWHPLALVASSLMSLRSPPCHRHRPANPVS